MRKCVSRWTVGRDLTVLEINAMRCEPFGQLENILCSLGMCMSLRILRIISVSEPPTTNPLPCILPQLELLKVQYELVVDPYRLVSEWLPSITLPRLHTLLLGRGRVAWCEICHSPCLSIVLDLRLSRLLSKVSFYVNPRTGVAVCAKFRVVVAPWQGQMHYRRPSVCTQSVSYDMEGQLWRCTPVGGLARSQPISDHRRALTPFLPRLPNGDPTYDPVTLSFLTNLANELRKRSRERLQN